MREALVDLLCCPDCQEKLVLTIGTTERGHVMTGALACRACVARWPIEGGVPNFVVRGGEAVVEQTTHGFARNWNRYSDVILANPALNDDLFRDWIEPLQPESFAGNNVLEAGCGMGRWLAAAAPHAAAALVGFDYSEVVHAAFRNTRHLKSVHVVRADIFRMPFPRPGRGSTREPAFDVCYSIGVLHHTPDAARAFACLLDVVRPRGVLSVWVYGKEHNEWIERVVTPLRVLLTSRLPDPVLLALSKALTLQLVAAARTYVCAFPTKTAFPYDAYTRHILRYPRQYLEHVVYDHLVPQLAQYFPRNEVERWACDHGLAYVVTARNNNSWRLMAARAEDALRAFVAPAT